jgi:hypothetical protein
LRSDSIPAILVIEMGGVIRYRGKEFSGEQIELARRLIEENPSMSRRRLSAKLCQAWDWRQPSGQLCDMICRGMLLECERAGLLKLPPRKFVPLNPLAGRRKKPPPAEVERSPIGGKLKELGPLEIRQVRRGDGEGLWGSLIEGHHYLGYSHLVGEQLKYLVFSGGRPIAALGFSSAPRHLGPRDRFIGWTAEQRRANIRLLASNNRFLILPWVRVPFLASHLLARIARRISSDWQSLYHHPIYFLETFVDPQRFAGTSYRAANWVLLGRTTGRGKDDQTHRPNRSLKDIWGYPLVADFRRELCGGAHG